jgi:TonB family protein
MTMKANSIVACLRCALLVGVFVSWQVAWAEDTPVSPMKFLETPHLDLDDFPELKFATLPGKVVVLVTVDAAGNVIAAEVEKSSHPVFEQSALNAVQRFRLSPAKEGDPAERKALMPIVFNKGFDETAKNVKLIKPAYPKALRRYGNIGAVKTSFVINKDGTVKDIQVLSSAHPLLEAAAVSAILKSIWEPAKRQGEPVEMRVVQPLSFSLENPPGSLLAFEGVLPFNIPAKPSEKLQPELQYDKPPVVKVAAASVYPYELLKQRVKGKATISFMIDPDGRVRQTQVLSATHADFGAATEAMMQSWQFEPAMRRGEPIFSVFKMEHVFDEDERDSWIDDDALRLLRNSEKNPSLLAKLSELDALPVPLYKPMPAYPFHLKKENKSGIAIIEFVLDDKGAVHFPRIVEADQAEFGWAAATAIVRWRFTPPLQKGKPVQARLRLPMRFNAGDELAPTSGMIEPKATEMPSL